ncbi:hypothetical protein DSM106972_023200 [Dulcicalothrix desertica PCC 7102]|uniref:DUF2262 domain-containing protein n=1 Tax=Dulcicalothrix desertica PCC 7102 TaxID=232991 RepID=A0A3S1CGU1_9CYAN|nr:DUF2262 domain-containing protein [Dulcicalothrix desertica]RUT07059.1 hypothetical protein DSM106972_023200 [Dulcicalothrix desertica PCC 7102]TWH61943.1 hypothetical protein CAL7102_00626 [Dulcicalothrix desertica PCC 7102]
MSNFHINSPVLGNLFYNAELDCYKGEINFEEISIRLILELDDKSSTEDSLNKAVDVFLQLTHYIEVTKQYAVEQLLKLKNNSWLEEDEELVSSQAFKKLIVLNCLVFHPNGEITFYYDDNDLFAGHQIAITIDKNNYFVYASI